MTKPPGRPKEPPISDNPSVLTTWATECALVVGQNGVVALTFCETRAIGDPPRVERRVVAMIALSDANAAAMCDRVRQVLFGNQTLKAGGPAN